MTISDMHVAFRLRADKLGSQLTRTILPYHIDMLINKAINQFVDNSIVRYMSDDNVDNTNKQLDDISTLIMMVNVTPTNDSSYGLPSKVVSLSAQKPKQILTAYCSVNQKMGEVRFTNPNKLVLVLNDYLSKTDPESVIAVLQGDKINLFEDNFSIGTVTVRYLKYPSVVKLATSGSIDCDLPLTVHDKIVDIAVDMFAAITAQDNYQLLQNETQKLE